MGIGITVECSQCGAEQSFDLGVGMAYGSLEHVITCVPKRYRPDVLEVLRSHQLVESDYSHELYHCPRCHSLHERFHVRLRYDGDKVFETEYSCRKCRVVLAPIGFEDVQGMACWNCGRTTLTAREDARWD